MSTAKHLENQPSSQEFLEIKQFWGSTLLQVEHFHHDLPGRGVVQIGGGDRADFLAFSGDHSEDIEETPHQVSRPFILVRPGLSEINIEPGMQLTIWRSGQEHATGKAGVYRLHSADQARIRQGVLHFDLSYRKLPALPGGRNNTDNRLMRGLSIGFGIIFAAILAVVGFYKLPVDMVEGSSGQSREVITVTLDEIREYTESVSDRMRRTEPRRPAAKRSIKMTRQTVTKQSTELTEGKGSIDVLRPGNKGNGPYDDGNNIVSDETGDSDYTVAGIDTMTSHQDGNAYDMPVLNRPGGIQADMSPQVQMTIRKHLNTIRQCYEQLLQRSPGTTGTVTMKFNIGIDGKVQPTPQPAERTTVKDKNFLKCIASKILAWRFNIRPIEPITVNYPFVLSPL